MDLLKGEAVKFIDASEWITLDWYSSGGTRAKRVLQSLDGDEWYFKCSEKKPSKDGKPEKHYKYEFWSEIIAYQLGNALGLNILRYDVAISNGEIGCISPLMIVRDKEQLLEVGRYMTALNPNFLPEETFARKEYTFQLLEETLKYFELTAYWPFFVETILFDAVIGNTDRHQENWAFIGKHSLISNTLAVVEEGVKKTGFDKLPKFLRFVYKSFFDHKKNKLNNEAKQMQLQATNIRNVAPVYDSGSSLMRELDENRVLKLLADEQALQDYINKGRAEIHWHREKLTHFNLITALKNSPYLEHLKNAASFLDKFEENGFAQIVNNIDNAVPPTWAHYHIPAERKQLIIKTVALRVQKLRALIDG